MGLTNLPSSGHYFEMIAILMLISIVIVPVAVVVAVKVKMMLNSLSTGRTFLVAAAKVNTSGSSSVESILIEVVKMKIELQRRSDNVEEFMRNRVN